VVSYLISIAKLKDLLDAIETKVEDHKLVSIALNELVPSLMPFVQVLCA
jgi:hypothetical protein